MHYTHNHMAHATHRTQAGTFTKQVCSCAYALNSDWIVDYYENANIEPFKLV